MFSEMTYYRSALDKRDLKPTDTFRVLTALLDETNKSLLGRFKNTLIKLIADILQINTKQFKISEKNINIHDSALQRQGDTAKVDWKRSKFKTHLLKASRFNRIWKSMRMTAFSTRAIRLGSCAGILTFEAAFNK